MHFGTIKKLSEVLEDLDRQGLHVEAAHVATVIDMLRAKLEDAPRDKSVRKI